MEGVTCGGVFGGRLDFREGHSSRKTSYGDFTLTHHTPQLSSLTNANDSRILLVSTIIVFTNNIRGFLLLLSDQSLWLTRARSR